MRTDQFDVQLFERAPKLRQTGAGECVRYIYAENTKLIAVEGQRVGKSDSLKGVRIDALNASHFSVRPRLGS